MFLRCILGPSERRISIFSFQTQQPGRKNPPALINSCRIPEKISRDVLIYGENKGPCGAPSWLARARVGGVSAARSGFRSVLVSFPTLVATFRSYVDLVVPSLGVKVQWKHLALALAFPEAAPMSRMLANKNANIQGAAELARSPSGTGNMIPELPPLPRRTCPHVR